MKNTNNDYKELGLFNNGEYLVFSFKKTEKIISAIYLVTNLFLFYLIRFINLLEGLLSKDSKKMPNAYNHYISLKNKFKLKRIKQR